MRRDGQPGSRYEMAPGATFHAGRDRLRRVRSSGALLLGDQVGSSAFADTRSRRPHVAVCSCDPHRPLVSQMCQAERPLVFRGVIARDPGVMRCAA